MQFIILRNITLPAIFTRQRFTIHLVPLQWIVNPWITKISSSTPPQNSNDSRSIGYIVLITLYTALNGCLLLVVLTSYDLVQMRRTGRFTLYINASQFIKLMLMLTRVKKYIPILKCTVTTITYMHNKLTQFILLRYCNDVCTCIFV